MLKYVNHDIVFQEFPDEVTLAINLSGCPNRCPGCHSPELRNDIGEALTEERLNSLLEAYVGSITCVALMGGDGAPEGVVRLLRTVRKKYPKLRTGWYSGRERMPSEEELSAFDYVKLGAWVEALGPLSSPTTNQRLYRIDKGQARNITDRMQRR